MSEFNTKNDPQVQAYIAFVEDFKEFIRKEDRVGKDQYKLVNLYGEKGLDDPDAKIVTLQDQKAQLLAAASCVLAKATLWLYYFRDKFADIELVDISGEDYTSYLKQIIHKLNDDTSPLYLDAWDMLIRLVAEDCMPDAYVGDKKKWQLVYTNMYWNVHLAMKSLKTGGSIKRMVDKLPKDADKIGNLAFKYFNDALIAYEMNP